jgi:DNA-directed RNA polymerase
LDYQGNEFSLALLNLYKGEKLTSEGLKFFYIYGANCYNENSIQKRPFCERIEWVNNNIENIYSMNKEFILKAECPTIFAAFCLNMKKLKENPDYIVHTPVFLDATCSGIQHFAAMLLDCDLAREVNLIKSTTSDVKDIYKLLTAPINKAINNI